MYACLFLFMLDCMFKLYLGCVLLFHPLSDMIMMMFRLNAVCIIGSYLSKSQSSGALASCRWLIRSREWLSDCLLYSHWFIGHDKKNISSMALICNWSHSIRHLVFQVEFLNWSSIEYMNSFILYWICDIHLTDGRNLHSHFHSYVFDLQ